MASLFCKTGQISAFAEVLKQNKVYILFFC